MRTCERHRDRGWARREEDGDGRVDPFSGQGKQSFTDTFRHIEMLSQMRARSVAAHSEKTVLFRPHAEI